MYPPAKLKGPPRKPNRVVPIDESFESDKLAQAVIDEAAYQRMTQVWRERSTMAYLISRLNLSKPRAHRAIFIGWPELGFPALKDLTAQPAEVFDQMHRLGDPSKNATIGARKEASKQAALEAKAAQALMESAVESAAVVSLFAAKVMEKIKDGKFEIEQVTPTVIQQLVTAVVAIGTPSMRSSFTIRRPAARAWRMQAVRISTLKRPARSKV